MDAHMDANKMHRKKRDGYDIGMLRTALHKSWKQQPTKRQLTLSQIIQGKRARQTDHC